MGEKTKDESEKSKVKNRILSKMMVILVLMLALVPLAASCTGGDVSPTPEPTSEITLSPPPLEPEPTEPESLEPAPLNFGEMYASYNGIEVTVHSVKEYPGESIRDEYPDMTAVQSGYQWILVELEIKNGTGDAIGHEEAWQWKLDLMDADENDNNVNSVYMRGLGEGAFDMESQIGAGQSRTGKLLFAIREDSYTYTFRYRPYDRRVDDTVMEIILKDSHDPRPSVNADAPPNGVPVDLIETSASHNGIDIIVHSVKEYPGDTIWEDYPDVTPVQNGYKWVLVELEIKNGTGDAIGYEEAWQWKLYIRDTDGNDNNAKSVYMKNLGDDAFDMESQIGAGQSRTGKLLFAIRADCHTYTFFYQPHDRRVDATVVELQLR